MKSVCPSSTKYVFLFFFFSTVWVDGPYATQLVISSVFMDIQQLTCWIPWWIGIVSLKDLDSDLGTELNEDFFQMSSAYWALLETWLLLCCLRFELFWVSVSRVTQRPLQLGILPSFMVFKNFVIKILPQKCLHPCLGVNFFLLKSVANKCIIQVIDEDILSVKKKGSLQVWWGRKLRLSWGL